MSIVEPAPFLDAREMLGRLAGLKPLLHRVAVYQLAGAPTAAVMLDGRLAAVVGFWPIGDGVEECFMACCPIEQLGRAVVAMERAGRLIIRRRAHHASVRTIVALIARSNKSGQRLARLAGFGPTTAAAPDADFAVWEIA